MHSPIKSLLGQIHDRSIDFRSATLPTQTYTQRLTIDHTTIEKRKIHHALPNSSSSPMATYSYPAT
jgi:hypothetical protein